MFASWVKMAAKAAALIAGVAIIVAVFANVQIPALNISQATTYLNVAYSIGVYYIPGFVVLFNLAIALISLNLAIIGARVALIAIKWILKINEG